MNRKHAAEKQGAKHDPASAHYILAGGRLELGSVRGAETVPAAMSYTGRCLDHS